MKSENSDNSQERIRKATELLQKFWWFSFFLIIAPLVVAIILFSIFNFAQVGLYIALSLSLVSFIFALLFFYKAFDKYRDNPFFLNKRNNLTARIHIIFLISIGSFVATPIFILISPFDSFIYLPLISYAILYNIVYYYYYFQPIDFYNLSEEEFKHARSLELMIKQPYNFLIVVNYIIHIVFLALTATTNFSWLYALITNLLFYIITITSTKNQVKKIRESIEKKTPILNELTRFKQRFVISIISLIFLILIQIPSIVIITKVLSGVSYWSLEILNNIFLALIFILFYFKSRFYVSFHYTSKLELYDKSEKIEISSESPPIQDSKYQKYNSILSCILVLLITLFSFLIELPLLILIILPFIYILLHYEQQSGLCSKKYNKYVILFNSVLILISISFGIIPVFLGTILLNFLVFCLSLYFVLQIFVKFEYFIKENILIYQNLLAITSIGLILYSFFPIAILGYTTFTSNPFLLLISNILLHSIFILGTLLISQYILGVRYFQAKSPKLFRRVVLVNSFLIELVIFVFINFRIYFLIELIPFLQVVCISSILFPIILMIFLYLNYGLHVFSVEYFLKYSYFSLWILLSDLFISLLIISLLTTYFLILAFDFLIASVLYYIVLKFGLKIGRVNKSKFKKYIKINSYFITVELLYLFFTLFYTSFHALSLFDNIIYSIFLSLAIVCGIINLFSKKGIFSEDLYIKINVFVLLYSIFIAFYFFLMLTFETFYVFTIPLMVSSIILFLPLLYLRMKRLYPKFTSKSIKINSILFSVTISLIPSTIGLQLFYLGTYFDIVFLIMTVINFTLYILFIISYIYYYILKIFKSGEKRVRFHLKLQVLIAICISVATIFYYSFYLLIDTMYNIILPLILTFSFLFIPLLYSYKKEIFNLRLVKSAILSNMVMLTCLFTSIPLIVGLNLLSLGLIFDINLFILNILNSSLYIFFVFSLILTNISKKFKLKEILIVGLKRLHIITLLIISFTTVFFYPFLYLFGTFYSIFLPLIALLFSWFFLFYYSYKREYFNLARLKKLTIYNFVALSCLIISIPVIIGLELTRIGLETNLILIITTTVFIAFCFLKISEIVSVKIKLKEFYITFFKLVALITWFSFTLLLTYYIASIFLVRIEITPVTFLVVSCCSFAFFILSTYTLILASNYFTKLSKLSNYQDIIIYGIIVSIASIFTFLSLSFNLFAFLNSLPILIKISILLGFFSVVFLLFLVIWDNFLEFKLVQLKTIIELTAWLFIKIILCTLLFSLIDYFAYQIFIINKITLFSLVFTFFTPISLYILRNLKYISSKNQFILKRITLIVFIISLLSLYFEILINLTTQIPVFYQNPLFHIITVSVNIFLILYYFALRSNKIVEERSVLGLFRFYFLSFILFISLLYFPSILSVFLLLISYLFILSRRSIFPIFRFLSYILLSYVSCVEIIVILIGYGVIAGFEIIFTIVYLLSMIVVIFFSILLNIKKNNNLEKFSLYSLISLLSFASLSLFTNIFPIYNITISLFILLLFIGISFYRRQDERYKWFINPCILLFIFDLVSFMSYSWLFNNPIFRFYNPILTFTLTLTMTGFGFVLLYNDAPARFRKKSFYIVLISIILSFPTFLYFLIIAALSMPLFSLVPLITAINVGVILFYLSIGIYQWKISWAIWKSGWYVWNILPFVNWFIIYESLTGMDIFTTELFSIGTLRFGGSFFLTLIICSLFFLPVVYTKIKKYFSLIVFIIWGESLFLLYWFSQNLFVTDILLRNLFFILFSVTLLMPLFAVFKFWKILSIFWIFPLTFVNASFLLFYLVSIGLSLQITISIVILVIGLFLIVYSFFPNIRSVGVVLIVAYFITLLGIFLTILFILYSIIQHLIFAINISLIVFGFTLFSSKYLELPKRFINLCLSWILIFNFSWLTFNTFSIFPGFVIFAFSLALTVFGFSFFIFNRYKMKILINKIIPYLFVAFGASLSITSLISILFHAPTGILISTFSTVFIIFLYFIFTEYRYILWFCIPIPITTPILEFLLTFQIIRPFWLLTWAMLYLITFQIIINLFKNSVKEGTKEIRNSILKIYQDRNQVKWLNLTCFLLNSICVSLFLAIILPNLLQYLLFSHVLIIYQICDFLIIWPILFLLCMKYVVKSELDIKIKDLLRYFSKMSSLLYLLTPVALSINVLLYMIFLSVNYIISIYVVLLIVSGGVFIEVAVVDRSLFYLLFNSTRNKFILWSWFAFCNTASLFLYLFYPNIFLLILTISFLNLITLHFLSFLTISKQTISKLRVILVYNLFVWSSFYIGSLISEGLILVFADLRGFAYYSLLFQNSLLILYILSYLFVKVEKNIKNRIEFILFVIFQGLLVTNLLYIFNLFGYLNFISINLIIFIEICLSFIPVYYVNTLLAEQKYPNFLIKIHSLLILILYCEISIMLYGLLSGIIGVYESGMASLSVLFLLTLIDIYQIKKVKIGYARLVHTISFFTVSLMAFLVLYNFITQYPFFLGLGIFVFMIMQFYTNYSLFTSLKEFYPKSEDILGKIQLSIHRLIGTGFYITICVFLLQILVLLRLELQLIFLILSFLIHVLMIFDSYLLKFLGKFADYIKVISWISIMTFTSTYLIWLYSTYFLAFFFTVIPIIIIILILEVAYLFKLLAFWKVIDSNRDKIKTSLISISYLNFISWPLYFTSLDLFADLNLLLASVFIMFVITLVDKVFNEKSRKSLRSFSFLIIGALLSIDLFLVLIGIPNFDLILNLSSSLLIFVIFLAIHLKPFKQHSTFASSAFFFWLLIFILLFLIVYRVSFLGLGITLLSFGILLYPFIFLLEELKRFINNIVDYLSKFFSALKIAIKNMVVKIFYFIKTNFIYLWIPFSGIISILCGLVLSPVFFNILNWIHSSLVMISIFGLLFLIIPYAKTDDADKIFRRRILRLSIGWGSVIGLIFTLVTPDWYIFTIFISITVVGTIIVVYLLRKEERQKISIKWRFYTLLILTILFILFATLLGIQLYLNFA